MDGEWMDEWVGWGWMGKASPAQASARKGKWVALALAGGRSNDESGAVPVIYSTPSDGAWYPDGAAGRASPRLS